MSFQARAQKWAMWPASRPTTRSASSSTIARSTRVRRSLSVKIRFSPTTPVSPVHEDQNAAEGMDLAERTADRRVEPEYDGLGSRRA